MRVVRVVAKHSFWPLYLCHGYRANDVYVGVFKDEAATARHTYNTHIHADTASKATYFYPVSPSYPPGTTPKNAWNKTVGIDVAGVEYGAHKEVKVNM